jgi:RNA polymerase sigma-54 factor
MPDQGLQQVQRLGLQQTLSPQMQQSLQILQAPALELRTLVQQEMLVNPTIEEVPVEEGPSREEPSDPAQIEQHAGNEPTESTDKEFAELAQLDQEWRDYFAATNLPVRRSAEEDQQRRAFFESIVKPQNLHDHLLDQLRLLETTDDERALCEIIIGNLDERGYLNSSLEEISTVHHASVDQLQNALSIVQSLDPIGVGARDLRECLQLQLERLGHGKDSLAWQIVQNHLEDMAAKRYAEIASARRVDLEQARRAVALIGTCDPRPGSRFGANESQYITPELLVQKVGNEWVVIMNDDWLPRIRISNTYKDILGSSGHQAEVKSYVRERIRAGKFLIRSIHQRQHTILRIAQEILRVQIDFFENGRGFLKPLTMAEVSRVVGVHETTVSRAIAGKYMQTPHGVFELKYFFTSGIRTADGQTISHEAVKQAICELVAQEPSDNPLSDQAIMQALVEKKIPIARRTVAKYREELNIKPSHLRRSKIA